jgi:hypothetical protein
MPFARGDGPSAECPLELVELGEPGQHDVDRALPLLVVVRDVGEHATLGRLSDERRVGGVDECDHGARRLTDDPLDERECVLGALAEPDEGDVGALTGRNRPDVLDVDLAGDHFMSERGKRAQGPPGPRHANRSTERSSESDEITRLPADQPAVADGPRTLVVVILEPA